jgi:ribose transport system substrate-binding protein
MKPTKVLLSLTTHDNDYQQAHAASADAMAHRLGVSLEIVYAEGDAVTQVQQILSAIQKRDHGIDVVVTEPVGTAMHNVAEVAVKMGIAWCVLNREADYISRLRHESSLPVFEVSVDQLEVGRIQAQQVSMLLPSGGTILYIAGPSAGSAARLRLEGMTSRKPANIQVKTVTGNWTEDGGHHAVTSWLKLSTSKSAGFGAVVSQNDAMAIGARRAFGEIRDPAERETWLGMPFLGCDGLPETGQQYVHGKLLVATIVTPPVAGIGLETFMHWRSEGKAIPERLLVNPISFPAAESLRPQSLAQKA